MEEYQRKVARLLPDAGLPGGGPSLRRPRAGAGWRTTARTTDRTFPANKALRIEKGEPILTPAAARPDPESLPELEAVLAARMQPVGVLHALAATVHWLGWDRFFGPLSGHDAKLEEPRARYVSTVFGYGCHIGPAQLARAIDGLDRRQIIWINLRHISEEALDRVISEVVAALPPLRAAALLGLGPPGRRRRHPLGALRGQPALRAPCPLRRLRRHRLLPCRGHLHRALLALHLLRRAGGHLHPRSVLCARDAPTRSCPKPCTATRTGRARPFSAWPISWASSSTRASAAGRSSSGAAPARTATMRTSTRSSPRRWTGT